MATLISVLILFFHQRVVQYRIRPPKCIQVWISRKWNGQTGTVNEEKSDTTEGFSAKKLREFKKLSIRNRHQIEKEGYEVELLELWKNILNYVDLICLSFFLIIQCFVAIYMFR